MEVQLAESSAGIRRSHRYLNQRFHPAVIVVDDREMLAEFIASPYGATTTELAVNSYASANQVRNRIVLLFSPPARIP